VIVWGLASWRRCALTKEVRVNGCEGSSCRVSCVKRRSSRATCECLVQSAN
jgi:hypothetical protein